MTAQETLPCGACGTWECGDCGNRTTSRNRFFPGQHTCPKCKSTKGHMLPIHHQKRRAADHADDVPRLHATMGAPRYPLEEPVSEYPEHDKLKAVEAESEAIGHFLEESGFILAEYRDVEGFAESRLLPVLSGTQQILADYFQIDLPELGREKDRMLDALRKLHSHPTTNAAHGQPAHPSGRNTMPTGNTKPETAAKTEAESPDITVWTTENSEAVVWGTHDLASAKKAYEAMELDTEPDWDDVRLMWGAPHLLDLEVWDESDYGDKPTDGWVPYMVYGF